jgi:hypothetical protein
LKTLIRVRLSATSKVLDSMHVDIGFGIEITFAKATRLLSSYPSLRFTSTGAITIGMELELQSPLTLVPNSFNVLIGPEEMLVDSLNFNLKEPQRLQVLYVSGNYSCIPGKLDPHLPLKC